MLVIFLRLVPLAVAQKIPTKLGQVPWGDFLRQQLSDEEVHRRLQGGPGGGGSTPSTECTVPDGTNCQGDGSTNYCDPSGLTYDATTGVFTGHVVTNGCNDHDRVYNGQLFSEGDAECEEQSIPTVTPGAGTALATLGRTGMTLSGGVNVYSAFEAGFADCLTGGRPCACDGGSCDGGVDVGTCESHLEATCTGPLDLTKFMDTCGGHASPYHIHLNPVCNYVQSNTGHSSIVGVMLDGYGLYGVEETAGMRPCDLDACHGHVGPVPADPLYGITASVVYHYHTTNQDDHPGTWTPACYGSPSTYIDVDACKALYTTCDDGDDTTLVTVDYPNGVTVDPYCPCWDPPLFDECVSTSPTTGPMMSPTVSPSSLAPTREPIAKPTNPPAGKPTPGPKPTNPPGPKPTPAGPTTGPTPAPVPKPPPPMMSPTVSPSSLAPTRQPIGKPTNPPGGKPTPGPKPTNPPGPKPTPAPKPTNPPGPKPTPAPQAEPSSPSTNAPTRAPRPKPTSPPQAKPTPEPMEPTMLPTPAPFADAGVQPINPSPSSKKSGGSGSTLLIIIIVVVGVAVLMGLAALYLARKRGAPKPSRDYELAVTPVKENA